MTDAARTECQACRASIRFVRMKSGRTMPVNAEPDPNGTIEVQFDELALPLTGEALWQARQDGVDLFVSHFATCPRAKDFRRRR